MDWYTDCKRISKQEVELPNISRVLGLATDRKKGSGRPMTEMTNENLAEVEQLCQSQDDKPETHNNQRQAALIIGVSWRYVQRMLNSRGLHMFKRIRTSAVYVL